MVISLHMTASSHHRFCCICFYPLQPLGVSARVVFPSPPPHIGPNTSVASHPYPFRFCKNERSEGLQVWPPSVTPPPSHTPPACGPSAPAKNLFFLACQAPSLGRAGLLCLGPPSFLSLTWVASPHPSALSLNVTSPESLAFPDQVKDLYPSRPLSTVRLFFNPEPQLEFDICLRG